MWCGNCLIVGGEGAHRFYEENKGDMEELSFAKSMPIPAGYTWETLWQKQNWGCFSDASSVEAHLGLREVTYNFLTEGVDPEAWLLSTSKQYPNLVFYLEYHDESMDMGSYKIKNGAIIEECRK